MLPTGTEYIATGTVSHVFESLLEPGVCAADEFLYPKADFLVLRVQSEEVAGSIYEP